MFAVRGGSDYVLMADAKPPIVPRPRLRERSRGHLERRRRQFLCHGRVQTCVKYVLAGRVRDAGAAAGGRVRRALCSTSSCPPRRRAAARRALLLAPGRRRPGQSAPPHPSGALEPAECCTRFAPTLPARARPTAAGFVSKRRRPARGMLWPPAILAGAAGRVGPSRDPFPPQRPLATLAGFHPAARHARKRYAFGTPSVLPGPGAASVPLRCHPHRGRGPLGSH